MASIEKRLRDRELLLLVARAAGGTLGGRTVAQKLVYFAGRKLGQPTGHSPYFFGPYSEDFDAAIRRSALAGEFDEQVERIPDWYGGPDATKHMYTLTERGAEEAARIADEHPDEAQVVTGTIALIAEAVPDFRQKTLSAAAKIDLIVDEQEDALPLDEVRTLAKQLGWKLTQGEMRGALEVLTRLELVEVA
jgi:uncharacterized protein YwgA